MGLAILPARLKGEIAELVTAIKDGSDIRSIESIAKHADWVDSWKDQHDLSGEEAIEAAIKEEIGKTFAKILECAGVYKRDEAGTAAFMRFVESL
jgi:UDPglucose--hexose-1-phosphate uridylyltransferase